MFISYSAAQNAVLLSICWLFFVIAVAKKKKDLNALGFFSALFFFLTTRCYQILHTGPLNPNKPFFQLHLHNMQSKSHAATGIFLFNRRQNRNILMYLLMV